MGKMRAVKSGLTWKIYCEKISGILDSIKKNYFDAANLDSINQKKKIVNACVS